LISCIRQIQLGSGLTGEPGAELGAVCTVLTGVTLRLTSRAARQVEGPVTAGARHDERNVNEPVDAALPSPPSTPV
jgi:hypothetical protein